MVSNKIEIVCTGDNAREHFFRLDGSVAPQLCWAGLSINGWVIDGKNGKIPWDNISLDTNDIVPVRPGDSFFGLNQKVKEAKQIQKEARKKLGTSDICVLVVRDEENYNSEPIPIASGTLIVCDEKTTSGYNLGPVTIEDLNKTPEELSKEMRNAQKYGDPYLEHSKRIAYLAVSGKYEAR